MNIRCSNPSFAKAAQFPGTMHSLRFGEASLQAKDGQSLLPSALMDQGTSITESATSKLAAQSETTGGNALLNRVLEFSGQVASKIATLGSKFADKFAETAGTQMPLLVAGGGTLLINKWLTRAWEQKHYLEDAARKQQTENQFFWQKLWQKTLVEGGVKSIVESGAKSIVETTVKGTFGRWLGVNP